MARRSVGVAATTADVSERAVVPWNRATARAAAVAVRWIEERLTQVRRRPRLPGDAPENASLLGARLSDTGAVVRAVVEPRRLCDAGRGGRHAPAGGAAASSRATDKNGIGALADMAARTAVHRIADVVPHDPPPVPAVPAPPVPPVAIPPVPAALPPLPPELVPPAPYARASGAASARPAGCSGSPMSS